jgi:hypothetical protein
LFDLFGLACFANKNKNCQLSYSLFQTSQTGQWYSDTSPFSIPCSPVGVEESEPMLNTGIKKLQKYLDIFTEYFLRFFFYFTAKTIV